MGTAAIRFIDRDRPVRQVLGDHERFAISASRHAAGCDRSIHLSRFSAGLDTVRGRMIAAGPSTLIDEVGTVDPAEAQVLSATVIGSPVDRRRSGPQIGVRS